MNDLATGPPDRESFGKRFAPTAPKARAVRDLYALLSTADANAAFERQQAWVEQLLRWLSRSPLPKSSEEGVQGESPRAARLRLLVTALEQIETFRHDVACLCAAIFRESTALQLLSRSGLPGDRSFLHEVADRISRRTLPAPRDERDLGAWLGRVFNKARDAEFFAALDPVLGARLLRVLDDGSGFGPLARTTADAALLLATRVSALGLSDDIRARSQPLPLRESPLFRLPRVADALLLRLERASDGQKLELQGACAELAQLSDECTATVLSVTQNLEQFGVSVDVVYRLEVISKSLARLRLLLAALTPNDERARALAVQQLIATLIKDRLRDRSILDLARTSTHLLARKIIERAGRTGEHYITSTRGEYVKMLGSAAGGGVLTAGTAMLKFAVMWGHFAPFVEGILAGTNYATSFLLLQMLGLTLATKQPSMTAASLAATLRETEGHAELDELVATIARITRSQLAAVIGNIGLVVPASLALDRLCVAKTGHSFLDGDSAEHVLRSLHPLQSGTVFYAMLTGVILWVSSIIAGWLDNWAVYRRLPEALAQHRLRRVLGQRTMLYLSRVFARNVSGFGGSVSLGFLLGMTPIIGKFLGLPIDVRHVTLSTGSLVFAATALGRDASALGLLGAIAGIAVIGVCNFGVSFTLALLVALRAREVNQSDRLRLLGAVLTRLLKRPRDFFLPP